MFKNKSGQIGETVTWMVATVVVLIILFISIFVVQFFGKKSNVFEKKLADPLAEKSFYSFLLKEGILEKLQKDRNLNDSNGILAENIFENFYKKDYGWAVWLGVFENGKSLENDFFGDAPQTFLIGVYNVATPVSIISKKIKLNENSNIELILMEGGAEDSNKKN